MEKKFRDSKFDWAILCKNCGHVREAHEHHEFEGWSCIEYVGYGKKERCSCNNWEVKCDENGNVLYNLKEEKK